MYWKPQEPKVLKRTQSLNSVAMTVLGCLLGRNISIPDTPKKSLELSSYTFFLISLSHILFHHNHAHFFFSFSSLSFLFFFPYLFPNRAQSHLFSLFSLLAYLLFYLISNRIPRLPNSNPPFIIESFSLLFLILFSLFYESPILFLSSSLLFLFPTCAQSHLFSLLFFLFFF
jgi:hypothetical protein